MYFFKSQHTFHITQSMDESTVPQPTIPTALTARQVAQLVERGPVGGVPLLVVDTRDGVDFEKGAIPSSIFCGYDGPFEDWMGIVFPDASMWRVVFICYSNVSPADVMHSLQRVGFNNVVGYLEGGMDAWRDEFPEAVSITHRIDPADFVTEWEAAKGDLVAIDVSTDEQVADGTWRGSLHFPLVGRTTLERIVALDAPKVYLFCTGAYRSLMVKSILTSLMGYTRELIEIRGGYMGMQRCPSCTPFLTATA